MLVQSCLFVLLSLLPHIDYISTVLFEQINDDDDNVKDTFLARRSLSIQHSVTVIGIGLSLIPSVGLCMCRSVCVSGKCIVAKRLIGSGCLFGW